MRRLRFDKMGATSIEYSLMAVGVGLVLLVFVNGVGKQLKVALAPLTGGLNVSVEARDTNTETDVVHTGSIRR
jgi:Flp pilus assembly pilin Flp